MWFWKETGKKKYLARWKKEKNNKIVSQSELEIKVSSKGREIFTQTQIKWQSFKLIFKANLK